MKVSVLLAALGLAGCLTACAPKTPDTPPAARHGGKCRPHRRACGHRAACGSRARRRRAPCCPQAQTPGAAIG